MLATLHPAVAAWFRSALGEPSPPQQQGWPHIRAGRHTLIAAPTGSGKTLTAFLIALDSLLQQGDALTDTTQVLYVSPLKALSNDVQKNLQRPLQEIRALDPTLPEVRVLVRSGDTPQKDRAAMHRKPPHILVTTPESLYLLLGSKLGRRLLATVRTLIVDEIHALARDKRGSHLALSLERLDHLVAQHGGALQRIGLSATQKPISETAALLVGDGRDCAVVDIGHLRQLDLAIEVPDAPLETVCSADTWLQVYARVHELIQQHRTTLVFVNTRKMAERVAARLADHLGKELVTSHHGSLSKDRRLDAEQRLKQGALKALVATSSLELGIDVGDVDLVVQIGPTAAIATLLQRTGRAGHGLGRLPKGRLFPLTRDELAACASLLRAVRQGQLDRTSQPEAPLDILAQQIVAAAAVEPWSEDELFELCRRARPFRSLVRERFDAVLAMHAGGRRALLHRDGVQGRVRGTRRAALTAILGGGAIPDTADYRVVLDPDDVVIGSVHEDFAVEASIGDVFQLGNASWQVKKVESGTVRVTDAKGAPPSLPFWVGEAPARTIELSQALGEVRTHGEDPLWLQQQCGLGPASAQQLADYLRNGHDALGAMPTTDCLVLERFFDETGGQQLVLHTPFGGRINRALGLALRKRFCTGFGFELQAAANEEALVLSLGPMHSFELADVWSYLHPDTATEVLVQALLQAPMFATRWRWNVTRSLLVERAQKGRRVPAPLLRMRADDALAAAFPAAMACPETLAPGPIEVPLEHPIVAQTVHDCLHEVMDVDGFLALLRRIRAGTITLHAVDAAAPSPFAEGVLHAMPYAFLDDAPLEERRTQAVLRAQQGSRQVASEVTELDPAAVAQVQSEAWPDPRDPEELHEALQWMGWLAEHEVTPAWRPWLLLLAAAGRAVRAGDRWLAAESSTELLAQWRGRLEAVFPLDPEQLDDDGKAALASLEAEGLAMRAWFEGRQVFGHRRLVARARRYMVERLRRAIEPVSQAQHAEFLQRWQHATEDTRLAGPRGLAEVLTQLAGEELPAEAWEDTALPLRVGDYKREWLDQLTLSGEFVWLKLSGSWRGPLSKAPLAIVPRAELAEWLQLLGERREPLELGAPARQILELLQQRGALFPNELQHGARLLPSHLEDGLGELVGAGLATCDSFAALRQLVVPPSRRRFPVYAVGRWSLLPWPVPAPPATETIEFAARALLRRLGVVGPVLACEQKAALPWRVLVRALRMMEMRGEVRGGRFVAGWSGEQFAAESAVQAMRRSRTVPEMATHGTQVVPTRQHAI